MFCMLLRKHLSGARLLGVEQAHAGAGGPSSGSRPSTSWGTGWSGSWPWRPSATTPTCSCWTGRAASWTACAGSDSGLDSQGGRPPAPAGDVLPPPPRRGQGGPPGRRPGGAGAAAGRRPGGGPGGPVAAGHLRRPVPPGVPGAGLPGGGRHRRAPAPAGAGGARRPAGPGGGAARSCPGVSLYPTDDFYDGAPGTSPSCPSGSTRGRRRSGRTPPSPCSWTTSSPSGSSRSGCGRRART